MLNQQKGSVVSSNANAIYYNSLKIEVENMRNLLDFLTRKQKESMLSSRLEGLQTSNIKIVDRAEIPQRPFSPNKQRTLLLALMLGLGGGIFLIFALNYLDNTVKSPEEVEKLLRLPALGFIPAVGAKASQSYYSHYYSDRKKQQSEQKIKTVELVNLKEPESTFAEHYRNIRTSLLLSTPDQPPKVFVVTSALPQEGKTVTAINLAVAFTQLGKKVLVLDCDLRRPRVHKIFRIKNTAGITSFLVGRSRIEDIIYRYPGEPNLHVLPSGPIPPNPVELIISKGMKEMMAGLRQHYDFIFIDAPPLMGIQDAILLGEHADGLLLVAWGGKTPRKVIEKAKAEIEKFNIKLFGVILNKVNMRRFSYAYSSYTTSTANTAAKRRPERSMIDLHGHYLPGVDDGADEPGAIAGHAAPRRSRRHRDRGGHAPRLRQHHAGSRTSSACAAAWKKWRADPGRQRPEDAESSAGAEVYFTSELLPILKDHRDLLTINNGSYFLLEFPPDYVYAHSKEFIFKILTEGFIPIISHAERNTEIQRSPAVLRDLVKAGRPVPGQRRQPARRFRQRRPPKRLRADPGQPGPCHRLRRPRPGKPQARAVFRPGPACTAWIPEKIDLYLHAIPEAIIADEAVPDIGEPTWHHHRSTFFDFFKKRDS